MFFMLKRLALCLCTDSILWTVFNIPLSMYIHSPIVSSIWLPFATSHLELTWLPVACAMRHAACDKWHFPAVFTSETLRSFPMHFCTWKLNNCLSGMWIAVTPTRLQATIVVECRESFARAMLRHCQLLFATCNSRIEGATSTLHAIYICI